MTAQRPLYVLWCASTILVSAFLLFQVQPMIGKMILPWFGGGTGVWTVCMLFFQLVLVLGYAYAHFLVRVRNRTAAAAVHGLLLFGALCLLPVHPDAAWQPAGGDRPTLRILMLLGAKVGLPYFLLASTGPLLQAWFARVAVGRSPYRLYALSNAGSLAGLLTYPFLFEPLFSTVRQGWLWSAGFIGFAVLCGGLAFVTARLGPASPPGDTPGGLPGADARIPAADRVLWLLLPALGSVMLLAVTDRICHDVAVTPFLWIAPLSLYLLTFIICFDREVWYWRRTLSLLTGLAIAAMAVVQLHDTFTTLLQLGGAVENRPAAVATLEWLGKSNDWVHGRFERISVQAGAYLAILFLVCMVCHGELVRRKPRAGQLTSFYLTSSSGGALGGLLVGIVCPRVFPDYWELNIGLIAGFVAAATVIIDSFAGSRWGKSLVLKLSLGWIVFNAMTVVVFAQLQSVNRHLGVSVRNFYGVLRVIDVGGAMSPNHYRALFNGGILHGAQFLEQPERSRPNTYYAIDSGVGLLMRRYPDAGPRRVALVGLGAGTMAVYGRPGDTMRFYEINPKVEEIARDYFTYLSDTQSRVEVVLGDARLSMEREPLGDFDMIVLDAFSGDAIPVHLLTTEAFELYFRRLKPAGVIAVHISNHYLDLTPIVAGVADHFGKTAIKVEDPEGSHPTDGGSVWMLVTGNAAFLGDPLIEQASVDYRGTMKAVPIWTDQKNSLLRILKW